MEHLLPLSNANHFLDQFFYLILQKNLNQCAPIHEAAKAGNFVILEFFFRMVNPDNSDDKTHVFCQDSDDELKTSLHLAAAQGKIPPSISIIFSLRSHRHRSITSQSWSECLLMRYERFHTFTRSSCT